ncbi:hypothetical protein DPMN_077239 [Dreissena polymorpha]|uniref:Uncharacterized protein n=1 Tax=Dreissena polymorpha TaxID=45954 RepID=A0A9D3YLJ8_DREPO|nr:hypothetical protein DPMN_077239 [Dreissena polymorpha]
MFNGFSSLQTLCTGAMVLPRDPVYWRHGVTTRPANPVYWRHGVTTRPCVLAPWCYH